MSKTTAYTVREIPLNLWARVKALATIEEKTIRDIILEALWAKVRKEGGK